MRHVRWTCLFAVAWLFSVAPSVAADVDASIQSAIEQVEQAGGTVAMRQLPDGRLATSVKYQGGDDGLALLSELPRVTELVLSANISGTGLAHLAHLKELRKLDLSGGDLTAADMESIARIPSLEWLTIDSRKIGDDGLEHLSHLPRLKRLGLHFTEVTDDGLSYLKSLAELEELHIEGEFDGSGLRHLARCPRLKRLGFGTDKLVPSHLKWLIDFKQLEELYLEFSDLRDSDLTFFPQMPKLTFLDLSSCENITPKGLARLGTQPHLRRLMLAKRDSATIALLQALAPQIEVVSQSPCTNPFTTFPDATVTAYKLNCQHETIGEFIHFSEPDRFFHYSWILEKRGIDSGELVQRLQSVLVNPANFQLRSAERRGDGPTWGLHFRNGTNECELEISAGFVSVYDQEALGLISSVERLPTGNGFPLSERGQAELNEIYRQLFGVPVSDERLRIRLSPRLDFAESQEELEGFDNDEFGGYAKVYELDASLSQISDGDLELIARAIELEKLDLSGTNITDFGLQNLRGLLKLRELKTANTRVTEAGLRDLKNYLPRLGNHELNDEWLLRQKGEKDLRALSLSGAPVTDAGLAHLAGLERLEVLSLAGTNISDAGMQHLAGMKNLRRLDVSGTKVTGTGLSHLSGLPNLEVLTACELRAGSVSLRQLPKLTTLELTGSRVEELALDDMESFSLLQIERQPLKRLVISNLPTLSLIEFDETRLPEIVVTGSTKFSEVSISGKEVTDADLSRLRALSELKTLSINHSSVTGVGFDQLASWEQLEEIHTYDSPISGAGLARIANVEGLKVLQLQNTALVDKDLRHLRGLKRLEYLSVGEWYVDVRRDVPTRFTDDALAQLSGMTSLKSLSLEAALITDEGLSYLQGLPNLQSLHIGRTQITDGGVEKLTELEHLTSLIVTGSEITDDGIQGFAELTSPEYLFLFESSVTREGVKRLKKALPECDIRY